MSFQDIRKINIVIVAGGWSNERSVSINSGKNVFNSLNAVLLPLFFSSTQLIKVLGAYNKDKCSGSLTKSTLT